MSLISAGSISLDSTFNFACVFNFACIACVFNFAVMFLLADIVWLLGSYWKTIPQNKKTCKIRIIRKYAWMDCIMQKVFNYLYRRTRLSRRRMIGSSPTPSPLSRQQVGSLSHSSCVLPAELTDSRGRRGGGGAKSHEGDKSCPL